MGTNKLIIANWKMNLTVGEASLYIDKLEKAIDAHRTVEIVLMPGMLALQPVGVQLNYRKFKLGAQNFYWRDEGAYTGEVSANQLRGLVKYALVGHSERRHIFHEHGQDIGRKMQAAIRNQIRPVLCVGETATERADGETVAVLHDQLIGGLHQLTAEDMEQVVIAYEPVWAISSGRDFAHHEAATPKDCKEAHLAIRRQLTHLFGKKIADAVPVIYGGSVASDNVRGFLETPGVDGVLVGGASLQLEQFASICETAYNVTRDDTKK